MQLKRRTKRTQFIRKTSVLGGPFRAPNVDTAILGGVA